MISTLALSEDEGFVEGLESLLHGRMRVRVVGEPQRVARAAHAHMRADTQRPLLHDRQRWRVQRHCDRCFAHADLPCANPMTSRTDA